MKDLVSIIIPAYNSQQTVGKSIRSCLNQTYSNIEIIVIDDGSTDSTHYEILKLCIEDSRVKCFKKENGGVSSARNLGINKSSGIFISFLDSDDLLHESFIENCIELQTDLSFCKSLTLFDNGSSVKSVGKLSKIKGTSNYSFIKNYISRKIQINTNSWLIKRSIITDNNLKFEESISWAEDFLFFSKVILYSATFNGVDKFLTFYNVTDTESLSSVKIERIQSEIIAANAIIDEMNVVDLTHNQKRKIKKILLEYRVPATVFSTASQMYNKGALTKEEYYKLLTRKTITLSLANGLRSIKLSLRIAIAKIKLWGMK